MPSRFCPLCGIWMIDRHTVVSDTRLWLKDIRIEDPVKSPKPPLSLKPGLTGIGYFHGQGNQVLAPRNPEAHHSDPNVHMNSHRPYIVNDQVFFFPLHNECWNIFSLRIGGSESIDQTAVSCLLTLLLSTSIDQNGYRSFCQELGAATGLQRRSNTFSGLQPTQFAHLIENPAPDPLEIIQSRNISGVQAKIPSSLFEEKTQPGTLSNNYFDLLPLELIHVVLENLSSEEITILRSTCRAVARVSTIELLKQSFWRSRFAVHYEMGFASFLVDLAVPFDFKDWYFFLKRTLMDKTAHHTLQNRKRIWTATNQLIETARLIMKGVQGHNFSRSEFLSNPPLVGANLGPIVRCEIDGDEEHPKGRLHRRGCMEIQRKVLLFPDIDGPVRIGVSTLRFGHRNYICGLRISTGDQKIQDSAIGIMTSAELMLDLESLEDLNEVRVGVVSSGIISISFVDERAVQGPRQTLHSPQFQASDSVQEGICRLLVDEKQHVCGFWAGFDGSKFVSFGIIQRPSTSGIPHRETSALERTLVARIWSPECPTSTKAPVKLQPPLSKNKIFPLTFNMDFGGLDGTKLCLLTQINAFVNYTSGTLRGLQFLYADSTTECFGRCTSIVQTFLIAGPSGERIVRVEVPPRDVDSSAPRFRRKHFIKIHTNFGNSMTCGFGFEQWSKKAEAESFQCTEGESIKSIIAVEGSTSGTLKYFSILASSTMGDGIENGEELLKIAEKFANNKALQIVVQSANLGTFRHLVSNWMSNMASLENLRRVRVFWGAKQQSRLPKHICGLWIEYWGSPEPKVVGQIFHEEGSLELSQAETLSNLSFWMEPDAGIDFENPEDYMRYGKIVGIGFYTSQGRSVVLGCQDAGSQVEYHGTRLEPLIAISWAYGPLRDHPCGIASLNFDGKAIMLQPPTTSPHFSPGIFLWDETAPNGKVDGLRSMTFCLANCYSGFVSGIIFEYNSGKKRKMGTCSRNSMRTAITFNPNELLVKIETVSDSQRTRQICLHFASPASSDNTHKFRFNADTPLRSINVQYEQSHNVKQCYSSYTLVPTKSANVLVSPDTDFQETPSDQTADTSNSKTIVSRSRTVFACPEGMRFAGFWNVSNIRPQEKITRPLELGVAFEKIHEPQACGS